MTTAGAAGGDGTQGFAQTVIGAADDGADSTVDAGGGAFNLAANLFGNANAVDGVPNSIAVSALGMETLQSISGVTATVSKRPERFLSSVFNLHGFFRRLLDIAMRQCLCCGPGVD